MKYQEDYFACPTGLAELWGGWQIEQDPEGSAGGASHPFGGEFESSKDVREFPVCRVRILFFPCAILTLKQKKTLKNQGVEGEAGCSLVLCNCVVNQPTRKQVEGMACGNVSGVEESAISNGEQAVS